MTDEQHFIDGSNREPVNGEYFEVVAPATGQVMARAARGRDEDVGAAVAAARKAQPAWAALAPATRAAHLRRLASAIQETARPLVEMEVRNAGKPLSLARQEVAGCVDYLFYYAG